MKAIMMWVGCTLLLANSCFAGWVDLLGGSLKENAGFTSADDLNGWTMVGSAEGDVGVNSGGYYYLKDGDDFIFKISDYTLVADADIRFTGQFRDGYSSDPAVRNVELYYVEDGSDALDTANHVSVHTMPMNGAKTTVTVTFSAADITAAIGKKIGIKLWGATDITWDETLDLYGEYWTDGIISPDSVSLSRNSESIFDVSWTNVDGATGYFLDVATDDSFTNFVDGFENLSVSGTTSVTVPSLDQTYYIRMRSTTGTDTSASSVSQNIYMYTFEKVADYSFSEKSGDALDSTGITGSATLNGTIQRDGDSYEFTAMDETQYVNTPALGLTTNTVTFSFWIKPTAFETWAGLITSGPSGGYTGNRVNLQITNITAEKGDLRFYWDGATVADGTSQWNIDTGLSVKLNEWNFVAMAVTPVGATFYCGTETGANLLNYSTTGVTFPEKELNALRINGDNSKSFTGFVKNVRVWNYTRSGTDLQSDYTKDISEMSPVIGLDTVLYGNVLSWSVENEEGVERYEIVSVATGEVIYTINVGEEYSCEVNESVVIRVVDKNGYTQSFSTDSSVAVLLEVKKGWNLLSLPCEVSNFREIAGDSAVWIWKGAKYVEVENVAPLQGFWLYSEAEKQVQVTGKILENRINLVKDWNLAGPTENCFIPEGLTVYTWGKQYRALADYDTMLSGKGYWIYSQKEASLPLK